jgi:hypothetical protein
MPRLPLGATLRRHVAPIGLLAAGCLLVFLIALSPHLVHHAFEKHHGLPECPLLLQSQLATADLQPDAPTLEPPAVAEPLPVPEPTALLPTPFAPTSQPRAPPSALASV